MALSALDNLTRQPSPDEVSDVLGSCDETWHRLTDWLTMEAGADIHEWMSSGKKYGWALRAKKGSRTIAYLIPQHGSFLVGIVLGDRAMVATRDARLSDTARSTLDSAMRYGEGTGFRLPVESEDDLTDVRTLVRIKLAH